MVRLTIRDRIARITLDNPVAGNALDAATVSQLESMLRQASEDQSVCAIILDAVGDTFSRGASKELLLELVDGSAQPADILLPRTLMSCPVPIIAAMAGHAIGGGFALGLAADIVMMARESRYGFTFMQMGFTPGMGTTALCQHVLSPAQSHELLFTGELRRGRDFAGSGINHILPKADIAAKADDLAAAIATGQRPAIMALKRTLSLPRRRAFEESLTLETLMHEARFSQPNTRQAIEREYVE